MKISVVVPFYNAEKYISRCIRSIIEQTYCDIELILVNDGSTDSSEDICRRFAAQDKRILCIRQKNQGQGSARNNGMSKASGEYFCFVDVDDVLPPNALSDMAEQAKQGSFDIVAGGYVSINGSVRREFIAADADCIIDRDGSESEKRGYHRYKTSSAFGYVWGKLYKASFLRNNGLVFDDIRKVFMEDTLFNVKAYSFHPSYFVSSRIVYHYYIYETSTSHKEIEHVSDKYIRMLGNYKDFLQKNNCYMENLDLFAPLAARTFVFAPVRTMLYGSTSFRGICSMLKEFSAASYMKYLLHTRGMCKALFHIGSVVESLFYIVCLLLLKLRLTGLLALMFLLFFPIFKSYLRKKMG